MTSVPNLEPLIDIVSYFLMSEFINFSFHRFHNFVELKLSHWKMTDL